MRFIILLFLLPLVCSGTIISYKKSFPNNASKGFEYCNCYDTIKGDVKKYSLFCSGIGKELGMFKLGVSSNFGLSPSFIENPLYGRIYLLDFIPRQGDLLNKDSSIVDFKSEMLPVFFHDFYAPFKYHRFIINTSNKVTSISDDFKRGEKRKIKNSNDYDFCDLIGVEIDFKVLSNGNTEISYTYYSGEDLMHAFYE